jgi:hypothetical protein
MPMGKIEEFAVSEPEPEIEEYEDLLKDKKPTSMIEIINILKQKGGISVGNFLGIQNTFSLIEASDKSDKDKSEMFSVINLLICLANMYLQTDFKKLEEESKPQKV